MSTQIILRISQTEDRMFGMFTMQERLDKAIYKVRRASLAPVERDRESSDYDSGDQSELMRLCNTKRIAGVSIVLLGAGAVLVLIPANIRYAPLKVIYAIFFFLFANVVRHHTLYNQ